MSGECTCPEPEPHVGPGTPIRLPGKSHRRGCPVAQPIFDVQGRLAREAAERFATGGIVQTPGERAEAEVRDLRRRVEALEARARRESQAEEVGA